MAYIECPRSDHVSFMVWAKALPDDQVAASEASPALQNAIHDLTAARTHGIIDTAEPARQQEPRLAASAGHRGRASRRLERRVIASE
jgi:hypothetical protein